MAALKQSKEMVDPHVQRVLDCTTKTLALLKDRSDISANLESELESAVKSWFSLPPLTRLTRMSYTLDSFGTELWNAATNRLREGKDECDLASCKDDTRLTVLLRVLAMLLIDTAFHSSPRLTEDNKPRVRTFKIALKVSRFCLDQHELELAFKVLERCAEHVSTAEEASSTSEAFNRSEENTECDLVLKRLVNEFYLLRMTHAWKSDQPALAEYFFFKVSNAALTDAGELAEKAAGLFHEAGKSFVKNNAIAEAVKWCERALAVLGSCDIEQLSQEAPELRLAITATIVEALSSSEDPQWHVRALMLIDQLDTVYGLGNRMAVALLHFSVIIKAPDSDLHQLLKVLLQLTRLAVLTDKTFAIIMQAVRRARNRYIECALSALEDFISVRLLGDLFTERDLGEVAQDRLEKASITYIKFWVSQPDLLSASVMARLKELFDIISQHGIVFSTKAAHAGQTLLWKHARAANVGSVKEWLGILLHTILDSAGQLNKARISRKAMVIAMAREDLTTAREAFFGMSKPAQDDSNSRYLAFKLALREEDFDLANESLAVVSEHADRDPTYLYACVLEAQQSDSRMLAIRTLQSLLDKQPPAVHIPSLLRCTARLLMSDLDVQTRNPNETTEDVVGLFENAAANVKGLCQLPNEDWIMELQWWSKNAYNLALRLRGVMHPKHLVRLLNACTKLLEQLPKQEDCTYEADVSHRALLCRFLSATALIVIARREDDNSENAVESYSLARTEIAAYMAQAEEFQSVGEDNDRIRNRTFELLKFDLECILRLEQWSQLDGVLQSLLHFEHVDRWETLIDLVVVVHHQTNTLGANLDTRDTIAKLVQKCTNDIWKRDQDIVKMSRWLRLAFTIRLGGERADFALAILDQAADLAKHGEEGNNEQYPERELQWLSISAFNKAVDLLSSGKKAEAETWIRGALELARYADDNGALHANLTYRHEAAQARAREGII